MKRVALVVVLLYVAALLVLTVPVLSGLFWSDRSGILDVLETKTYWALFAVMVAGQAALLVVPVQVASRRPTTRRSLLWPILVSGLMVGGVVIAAALGASEFLARDNAFESRPVFWGALAAGALTWLLWGVLFYRSARTGDPQGVVARHCRLMIQGSILEFLVAVPLHIVARQRHYCCAGVYTFIGIALGIAVVLLSFGPAVFVLAANRWGRLHPRREA